MPQTTVYFYKEEESVVPVLDWIHALRTNQAEVASKFRMRIKRLESSGIELREPIAKHLDDGICELRFNVGHVNYRFLYFFHGRDVAVVAHSFTKERVVPQQDIELAKTRRSKYVANPKKHTYVQGE